MRNNLNSSLYITNKVKTLNKLFGYRIAKIRKLKGLSQEELSDLTHLSTTTIGRLEGKNTDYNTTIETLFIILDTLHYPIHNFFCNNTIKNEETEFQYDFSTRLRIIAYNISIERKRKKYTQKELAIECKLGLSTIQKLDNRNQALFEKSLIY